MLRVGINPRHIVISTCSAYNSGPPLPLWPVRRPMLLVLSSGADLNARDRSGSIPLHYAAKNGRVDMVKYLVENGALVACRNSQQRTPYDVATNHIIRQYLLPLQLRVSRGASKPDRGSVPDCQPCIKWSTRLRRWRETLLIETKEAKMTVGDWSVTPADPGRVCVVKAEPAPEADFTSLHNPNVVRDYSNLPPPPTFAPQTMAPPQAAPYPHTGVRPRESRPACLRACLP
jgi:hypothetical protein